MIFSATVIKKKLKLCNKNDAFDLSLEHVDMINIMFHWNLEHEAKIKNHKKYQWAGDKNPPPIWAVEFIVFNF